MKSLKKLKYYIAIIIFLGTTSLNATTVNVLAHIKDSATEHLNTTTQKVNGITICADGNNNNNTHAGCDMSMDTGFDDKGNSDPSDDIYNGDMVIRTNDTFHIEVAVNANSGDVGDFSISSSLNTEYEGLLSWDTLPTVCLEDGSSISDNGLDLLCKRTDLQSGQTEKLTFGIRVSGAVPNDTELDAFLFTISGDNIDTDVTTTTDTTIDTDDDRLIVTASPRWNIDIDYRSKINDYEYNGVNGYLLNFPFDLEVDRVSGEDPSPADNSIADGYLGSENLGKDFNLEISADITSTSNTNTAKPAQCMGEDTNYEKYPVGYAMADPTRSVVTPQGVAKIECTQENAGESIGISYTHIDASFSHIPTRNRNEGSLPAYQKIAAIGELQLFVPYSDIIDSPELKDDDGDTYHEVNITVSLSGFDPTSISRTSNFNDKSENLLDNSVMVTLIYYPDGKAGGLFTKTFKSKYGNLIANSSYSNDGIGKVVAGGEFVSTIYFRNQGSKDFNDSRICDVIDTNTYNVTKFTDDTDTPIHFLSGTNTLHATDATVLYGVGYERGSWPPPLNENNSELILKECTESSSTTWYDDFDKAIEDGQKITKVMVKTNVLEKNKYLAFHIHLTSSARRLDGSMNETDTQIPNYTAVYDSVLYADDSDHWIPSEKLLSPNNNGCDLPNNRNDQSADRVCMVMAQVSIAEDLNVTTVNYGESVRVNLHPTFTTDAITETIKDTVVVKALLTKGLTYQSGSSTIGDPVIGTCNDVDNSSAQRDCVTNPENYQILLWDLGERIANEVIDDINYTVNVDVRANEGNDNFIHAEINASVDNSWLTYRSSDMAVTLTVPSKFYISKRVTTPFRDINQSPIEFITDVRNAFDEPINTIDIIDILPFNGDGTDGFNFAEDGKHIRTGSNAGPTDYTGTLEFLKVEAMNSCTDSITWSYTNRDPREINLSPKDKSNAEGGSTKWCDGDEDGPNGSCEYSVSDVTAVRLHYADDLIAEGLCSLKLQLKPLDNELGNVYTNNSGSSSPNMSLPVMSNDVSAIVPTMGLGDYVWRDTNGNGIQDTNEKGLEGVTLQLIDSDNNFLKETTTDSSGRYRFSKLSKGIEYKVKAILSKDYYSFSQKNAGSETEDSDVDINSGITDIKVLDDNEQYNHFDIGVLSKLTISGKAYKTDDNETISGVSIKLYLDKDNNNQLGINDELIEIVETTGRDGSYKFLNVFDGNYIVTIDKKDDDIPEDYILSGDEILDVDIAGESIVEKDFPFSPPNIEPTSDDKKHEIIMNSDKNVTLEELTGDDEDGKVVGFIIKSLPLETQGVLYLNDGVTPVKNAQLLSLTEANGLKFSPKENFVGDATFTYSSKDNDDSIDATPATFTIPVVEAVHISGTLYADGSGDGNIGGTPISKADKTIMFISLLDNQGTLLASKALDENGFYDFDSNDKIDFDKMYTLVLTTEANGTTPSLPEDWSNADGENINSMSATGNDGNSDGSIVVNIEKVSITKVDFGINQRPVAEDVIGDSRLNPGATTRVGVSTLDIRDNEDKTLTTITIKKLPINGTLYYNGDEVEVNVAIDNFEAYKFSVDPNDGNITVVFNYTTTDKAGFESKEATVRMPFRGIQISGNIFDDGNSDGDVNGVKISKAGDTPLFVNLLDSQSKLIATYPLSNTNLGAYSFNGNDSITANTDYKLVLTTDKNGTTPMLPTDWNNMDGESSPSNCIKLYIASKVDNTTSKSCGMDNLADGAIDIHVGVADINDINFGINERPTTQNVASSLVENPNTKIQVVDLLPKDREDGIPQIVTINTLPKSGKLYYDGKEVTKDQNITDFNNSKLMVLPDSGNVAVVFTYSATDSTGWSSIDTSRVRMPFYVPVPVTNTRVSTTVNTRPTEEAQPKDETTPIAEDETTSPDEQPKDETTPSEEEEQQVIYNLDITDDIVDANTEGAKTVINVLDNDAISDGVTIKLVNVKEGEILWNEGTAVGGTSVTTTDTIVVPGEGTWRVVGKTIVFTAEDGFEGTPTPIYYLVQDQHGNQSNIAEISIQTDCTCDTYVSKKSSSVSAFNGFSMILMMLITSMLSLLFLRREEEIQIKI